MLHAWVPVLPTPCPRASPGAAHAARPSTGRRIVHVSDLHFGSPGVAERIGPLLRALAALTPTIVAVSGDITRRAAPAEFRQARDFLDRLDVPFVVVPGNHDVPLAPWIRFHRRHARFLAHVVDHLDPFFTDGDVAVAGIDTSRSFAIDGGRARRRTLASLGERFHDVPGRRLPRRRRPPPVHPAAEPAHGRRRAEVAAGPAGVRRPAASTRS